MRFIYNIFIYIYYFGILIASLFNNKAKLWINGRKGIIEKLKNTIKPGERIVWFHCSSLGEFEQGRAVIESFKTTFPEYRILLTFFSPSGFEIRKNYDKADYVFYLPADTKRNVKRFIECIMPEMAFFIKYEYWYNYLNYLHRKNIPVYMISTIYRPDQHFFKFYGSWFRKHLVNIKHFFVQNDESVKLLNSININQVTKSGDTRFDRVYAIAHENKSFPIIEKFAEGNQILIAGSTWQKDEELIYKLIEEKSVNLKFILAPHQVDEVHVSSIVAKFSTLSKSQDKHTYENNALIKLSNATLYNITDKKVLIIDSIGLLSHIYKYATITYVGGGFGSGIHNILEAAVYGKPVIFGPNYKKFLEAKELIKLQVAFSVSQYDSFLHLVNKLTNDNVYRENLLQCCLNYVKSNIGSTKLIISQIKKY